MNRTPRTELALPLTAMLGGLREDAESAPLGGARWYVADSTDAALEYRFSPGALADMRYLTADALLDGQDAATWVLALREGEGGPACQIQWSFLNGCQARIRVPLDAVDQSRWSLGREGAWLKPLCWGDRVRLETVDRATLTVTRKGREPVRWCMTPLTAVPREPERLREPLLPHGPLLDGLGQSTLRDWPGKSHTADEVTTRLRGQLEAAPGQRWPDGFSRWGGWANKRFAASGFFRVQRDRRRWWFVDPDGCAFWSAGVDCVGQNIDSACEGIERAITSVPELGQPGRSANYLTANLVRAFGREGQHDAWARIALAELRRCGFNTIGNWSDWSVGRDAAFPYVRPLEPRFRACRMVYRDFPDVFSPEFDADAARYAGQLRETANDPAMIGYFLMNEPTWGFSSEPPAKGMLRSCPACATREALVRHVTEKYGGSDGISLAWGTDVRVEELRAGPWTGRLNATAEADLAEFSDVMVRRLFAGLADACKRVDPNHLNLGARYYTLPPDWAVAGMRGFDVFSMNCYLRPVPPAEELQRITRVLDMPALIGEWHFGALDVGLPATGIGRVPDQRDRGRAFRVFEEGAAAQPWCVGAHWFTLYDQSALGRFDGENYNIGFLDVCNRPYEEMAEAARAAHERMYALADGAGAPFDDRPEYLPALFY